MTQARRGQVTFGDLEMFVAFAQCEHFGQTARELGVSVPTVQRRLRALEREVGVALIENHGRRVRLRHAGSVLGREAQLLLRARTEALRAVREDAGEPRRLLRVAHTYSLGVRFVPGVLAQLLDQFPGLRLETRQESATAVASGLLRGDADVAFTSISPADPSISICPLFTETMLLAVRSSDALAARDTIDLRDTMNRSFVAMSRGSSSTQFLISACARAGFAPRIAAEASDLFGVESMVAAGLGVALVPERMSDYEHPGVTRLGVTAPVIERTIFLACPPSVAGSDIATSLLRIAREHGQAVLRALR